MHKCQWTYGIIGHDWSISGQLSCNRYKIVNQFPSRLALSSLEARICNAFPIRFFVNAPCNPLKTKCPSNEYIFHGHCPFRQIFAIIVSAHFISIHSSDHRIIPQPPRAAQTIYCRNPTGINPPQPPFACSGFSSRTPWINRVVNIFNFL